MLVFLLRVLCKRGWDTRLQCSTIGLQMYQLLKLTAVDQNSNQTQTLKLVIILNHLRFETSKSKLFMLFQITKIYVWLSLSLCFSLRAERGGAVGVVWWCTEISEARWEIVSGALQVLTQHGNTHWCDTVTIASQQNIFHQRRYRQLQTERYEDRIKKGLNINGYEGWRVWKRKSPPPPTHQISPCPGQTRKYGFENTRKKHKK